MTTNDKPSESLSYRDAGVDIDAGNELVERIKPAVRGTMRPEVLTGLGGFGALFRMDLDRWREPLLVSGYEGMRGREETTFGLGLVRLIEALKRLVALYETRGKEGDREKAAEYRKLLALP